MPGQYCFVCASDEGVFLDITPDNQSTFGDQVEACLSSKINKCTDLSSKICYKCAYELDQCAKFVQKYKKSHEISEPKATTSMPCCFLCYELVDSDRIFDITKDNNVLFNPLRKIRSIFNDDVSKKTNCLKQICLPCRYNLDVLYDLRRVHQETIANLKALINEEINYSSFPKVHTDVVNRKTTITTFPDITFYGTVNSDSESNGNSNMARGKRRGRKPRSNAQIKLRNNKSKVRNCDKCHNAIANGIDMYRFYHTGLTVCKNCWITIDPSSDKTRRSRHIQSYLAETKLCTVFLTDVLSQESYRKKKMPEVEKNMDDNMSYDSSQEEAKSAESSPFSVSSKRNHIVNGKARRGRKRRINMGRSKSDVDSTPSKVTRLSIKERTNTNEIKSTKASVDAEQQSSTYFLKGRKRIIIIDNRSSDSDGSLEQRETRKSKSNDHVNKTNRKKQKIIHERTTSNARGNSSDETSNEDGRSLRSKIRGATSSPTEPIKKEREERSIRSRTRSSSISSTEMTSTEFKSPKSLAQSEAKIEYACDKCNKKFDTKLSNAKHRLTHLKQAALKLEKLTVSSIKENQETEVDSQDDNISKEATSRPDSIADKHTDDLSEEIVVNVEDTDDEEIFSLSTKGNVKKKVENETSEDGNVIDKPDTARSESRVEEESANDGNIETNESEQREKSTDTPDETVTLEIEDDKDGKDEDTRDKHTTEDKDETSVNRDSDKSKDEDAETVVAIVEDYNVDEEKENNVDKEIESDAKVSSIQNEKTINECNKDKGDLDKETTRDIKPIRSPILSIHDTTKDNKDYSESCENNLENNLENNEDDKDEIIDEPKIPQCDLMDEFPEEDINKSEENFREILPTDETETLSDQRDLDNTIVINEDKVEELEKQQNRSDEENMEVEISKDIDEPNSAKDTIKPDLSNGEKHDEIKDSDEDDVVVVPVNNDDNDSNDDKAKCNNITEKTVPTDDLKEKRKLEEEIKELEELVDDNAMNNKHIKMHENSTYVLDNSSEDAANEILKEVFELAAAEVQQREECSNMKTSADTLEIETLENISREIRKSADMPSLDPISVMDLDDDMLN